MKPELIEVLSGRTNPEIDPHLHIWGWEITAYLFVGGLVAGLMILLAGLELVQKQRSTSRAGQLVPFWAIGLLSLGMLFLLLDLAYPLHVHRFYMTFQPTSPMSWGAWILLLVYPALVLLGLSGLDAERRTRLLGWRLLTPVRGLVRWAMDLGDRHRSAIVWTTLLVGVGLGLYTGLLLGTMAARPQWSSAVLGPLFLTSGISTGAAWLMLGRTSDAENHRLVRWDTVAIAVELALLAVLLLGMSTSGTGGKAAAAALLGGDYTAAFFSLVVVAGLLVPLALNLIEIRRHVPATRFAPVLVLIGGLALRAIFVSAGQQLDFPDELLALH